MSNEGVYLAFQPCGCVAVIISDMSADGEKQAGWTARSVADCIKKGYRVERVPIETYREGFYWNALTFSHKCPHVQAEPKQVGLFA